MAGQRSPETRPTTLSQQGSTVLSRSRNIIYYVITVVENNRHNENHGSRRIKHLFLVSQKIILQNHASRLLWKSRFTRKNISHFTFHGKKKGRSQVTKIPSTTLLQESPKLLRPVTRGGARGAFAPPRRPQRSAF